MSCASDRLKKLTEKNITSTKTYPPFIEIEKVVDYEMINPISYNSIKWQLSTIDTSNDTKMTKSKVYKHKKLDKYYITYPLYYNLTKGYIFDVTNAFDWEKVIEDKRLDNKHIINWSPCVKPIKQTIKYYPGSSEYDRLYPPIKNS